jgi:hypothetical protein
MPVPFLISVGMLLTVTFLSVGLWSALPPETALALPFGLSDSTAANAPLALFLIPAIMFVVTVTMTATALIKRDALKNPFLFTVIWLVLVLGLSASHGLVIRQALFALKAANPA